MKKLFSILFMCIISICLNAQTLYQRAMYGMNLFYTKGCVTFDNGFILTGEKNATSGGDDIFLIKLDAYGDTMWTKTYQYANNYDQSGEVLQTIDGGFFVTAGNYVLKTDSLGTPQWAKSISGARSAVQTQQGEIYIMGSSYYGPWSAQGLGLTKLDSAGNLIFSKLIGEFHNFQPNSLSVTNDGGVMMVGCTGVSSIPQSDGFMVKTDSLGNVEWTRKYGGSGWDGLWSVVETTNGDFLAVGIYTISNWNSETFIIKVDSAGALIWSREYHSGLSSSSSGLMITRTSDQNYVYCGAIQSPDHSSIMTKIDENGMILWSKAYKPGVSSNGSRFYGIYEMSDHCLIASGSYIEIPWDGFNYVVKCDSSGNSNCNSSNLMTTFTPVISMDSLLTYVITNMNISSTIVQDTCSCDSTYLLCSGTVGIADGQIEVDKLKVFPNPVTNDLNINSTDLGISTILIYDLKSRFILEEHFINSITLDMSKYSDGIYFYHLYTDGIIKSHGKFVISK